MTIRKPYPGTWVDKDTGIIWTMDQDTAQWVNSSATDGKPRMLAVDSVTSEDLKDGIVTEPKHAGDDVSTRTIIDLNVTEPKLADDSVSTRTIIDANVTLAKLAPDVTDLIGAGGTSRWEVLMASGITDPPDPVIASDGTDWLYGEAPLT